MDDIPFITTRDGTPLLVFSGDVFVLEVAR